MTSTSTLEPADTGQASDLPMLRFLTCGSVDDGKSSLIGRLLYDCQMIADDTLASLEADSRSYGTREGEIDLALLVDGLQAEREQGITIDVAYRYFSTAKRKFIVADTPGHEQYTRNMVTGASRADLAVILVDARKGLLRQTHRHTYIANLLGIRHVVLAINKMDLVGFDETVFARITADYRKICQTLGFTAVTPIPVSAIGGDNVATRSTRTPWYDGQSLLEALESADVASDRASAPFRLPVQWVCRPNLDFRGYAGTVASGSVSVGDEIVVLPSSRTTAVTGILGPSGSIATATAGDAIIVQLAGETDISRGDVLCSTQARAETTDQFAADVVWMNQEPLLKGRPYVIRCGTQTAIAQISEIKYHINVETLEHLAGRELDLNEIGVCNISTNKPLVLDAYNDNRETGGFILIDRLTNATVGVGMVRFALRRSHNIHWQALDIGKQQRADLKGQKACCLWFTGLSGSGKSTLSNLIEKRLYALGRHTYVLDGDNVRHGLNRDLGFTDGDRVENIRRVVELARLMVDAGLITIVSFISPFRAERKMARERMEEGEFLEIFVDTPVEVCEQRDPKGLYKKARAGELKNFTGISSPYERPEAADVVVNCATEPADVIVERILEELRKRSLI